jgi:hypothetical protein
MSIGRNADESDVDAYFRRRMARIAAMGGMLVLAGCLTVGPPGFVRTGEHSCYRGWFDVNTLAAPAVYFECARRVPYAEERVTCYPRIDRRMPGPRLLLPSHQPLVEPAALLTPPSYAAPSNASTPSP